MELPSLLTKDIRDEWYFIGALDKQAIEESSGVRDSGETWESTQIHVEVRLLDRNPVTYQHAWYRLPESGHISSFTDLGTYLLAMQEVGTPFTNPNTAEAVTEQVGNVYLWKRYTPQRSGRRSATPRPIMIPLTYLGTVTSYDKEKGALELKKVTTGTNAAVDETTVEPEPPETLIVNLLKLASGLTPKAAVGVLLASEGDLPASLEKAIMTKAFFTQMEKEGRLSIDSGGKIVVQ